MKNKYCKGCDEIKSIDKFYRAGPSYQTRCKPCHNIYRELKRRESFIPKPKLTPFQKLPEEKQQEILKYYKTMPHTALARKVGITRDRIYSWHRKGEIVQVV